MNAPVIRDVLYVLGNDLHRGRIRHAQVIRIHKDQTADLVVFADPDESLNESGHDRNATGVFVKTRVRPDPNGAPATWHVDPDSPFASFVSVLEAHEQQIEALTEIVSKLSAKGSSTIPSTAPEPGPAAA